MENTFLTYKANSPVTEQGEEMSLFGKKYELSDLEIDPMLFNYRPKPTFLTEQPEDQPQVQPQTSNTYQSTIQASSTPTVLPTQTPTVHSGSNYNQFKSYFDEVAKSNPEAEKYRRLLTDIARTESNFNSTVQNKAGAPAYGYFQFMQDGKKWNNISHYANMDIETFRNDPKAQITAAIKLAKEFERGMSEEDLKLASEQGYTTNALISGAWLGGSGGVKRVLKGQGNPSDKHWSKTGAGTTVMDRMKKFNYKLGGKINSPGT